MGSRKDTSTCPDCKCQFVQPFTCVTCGAEKLYDATVFSLQADNERLRAVLRDFVARMDSDKDGGDGVFEEDMERFAERFRAALEGK